MTIAFDVIRPYQTEFVRGTKKVREYLHVTQREKESVWQCFMRARRSILRDGGKLINAVLTKDEELEWLAEQQIVPMYAPETVFGLPYTVELTA